MNGKECNDDMTEREVTPRLPTSGQILGALVSRLGIRHPELQSRTARRYFSADPERLVKESSREKVIGAIAEALTGSGLVAPPQAGVDDAGQKALASLLRWHADHWDLLRSFVRRKVMRVFPSHLPRVWEAYVRLAAIDLALRVSAHLHLAGSSPAALDFLAWSSHTARGDFLNQKRQQTSLSLEKFTEAVGVTDNTVDAWMYNGARPSSDNLVKIAETLAGEIEGWRSADIAGELRALYWVSDVAALLSEFIGERATDECIRQLRRYAEATYRTIGDRFPAENRTEELTVLADWGVGSRNAEPLLSALIEQEPDDGWREDLRATGMDWIRRVLSVNLGVSLAEVDDLIKATEGRLLEDWGVGNPEAFVHYRRSMELQAQGKLDEALAEVEVAARLDPLDSANHYTLGSVKTSIGIARDDPALINEGLNALWLAVTLGPHWILPWTEIGLTLHYSGRSAEAVEHLRNVSPERGPLDPEYYSALGAACWKVGELPEALAAFEASLELDPEVTSALLAASEVALLIGDREKHRRYLRRARHFGVEEDTLEFWELLRKFGEEDHDNAGVAEHDRNIAVMDATIKLNPDDDSAYFTRGLSHFAKGDEDLAITDLDDVLQLNPDHAAAYVLRGILMGNRKQWKRVISDMNELIRLRPGDSEAYCRRGMAYGELDLLDQAIVDLCEAIRLDPDHSDAYRCRGDCLRYKGEYDQAIVDFDVALKLDPENAAAHLSRGASYRMKGDFNLAIADYDAALRLNPRDPLAHRFRGDAHVANRNYGQAISDCDMALNLSPGDPIAYNTRGNAHLFSGALELALRDFDTAVGLDPASGRFIYGRGLARELLGDAEGAAEDYQRAGDLGYDIHVPE